MIYKQNSGTTIAGLGRGGIDEKVTMQETEKSALLARTGCLRKLGISDDTFYTWCKKYGGIFPTELRHMLQLEEENLRLKRLVAEFSLDKGMLQDVLAKKS